MTTRLWTLLISLPILIVTYVVVFTDWIKPVPIEIQPSVRTILPKKAYSTAQNEFAGVYPVIFNFDASYKLTEIWVEEAAPAPGQTPLVLWHLKSKSGSHPVKTILFGRDLEEMDPAPGSPNPAFALQPDKPYKVIAKSGRRKGEATFSTRAIADLRPNF